jgi:hypothetical protein
LDGVGQAVFAWGDSLEGYIWHVPEADAKACMPTLARVFGGHAEEVGDHIEIVAADRYALEWSGDTLHVSTVGAPVREKLSPALRALIKTVPAHQVFWVTGLMLMNKFPKTTFWGTVEGANLHVTVNTAGNEAQTKELFGVVNDTLREMAAKKQIHFEDSWVKITGQHLEVVMPAATLAALHQD